jgi:hypothetical protein
MIHGLYIRNRPKAKWHLISTSVSVEIASKDKLTILTQAKLEGNEKMEAAIKTFNSAFYIPEFLSEITEQKLMFN